MVLQNIPLLSYPLSWYYWEGCSFTFFIASHRFLFRCLHSFWAFFSPCLTSLVLSVSTQIKNAAISKSSLLLPAVFHPICPHLFCTGELRKGRRSPGVFPGLLAEGKKCLTQPVVTFQPSTLQEDDVVAPVPALVHQDTQVCLCQAALELAGSQLVLVLEAHYPCGQVLTFSLRGIWGLCQAISLSARSFWLRAQPSGLSTPSAYFLPSNCLVKTTV